MSRREDKGGFSVLSAFSKRPEQVWPDGVLHHGVRALLLVGCAVLVTALFPPTETMRISPYSEGQVAAEDEIAEVAFSVPKSLQELNRQRAAALESVPPTFNFRPSGVDSMVARLDRFFLEIDSVAGLEDPMALTGALERSSISLGVEDVFRDDDSRALLRQTALRSARELLPVGLVDAAELTRYDTENVVVREGERPDLLRPREQILTLRDFYDRAIDLLPPTAPPDVQNALRFVLIQFYEFTLDLDLIATDGDRLDAANAVDETGEDYLEGQAIVRANEVITPEVLTALEAYRGELRALGRLEDGGLDVRPLMGAGLLNLLLLGVFGMLVYFYRNEVYSNPRWIALVALLVSGYFGAAALIGTEGLPFHLLPVAFVALTVAVLWDGRMALVLALVLAFVTAAQPPFVGRAIAVAATTMIGGAAAALSVRAVRRRAQAWIFAFIVAVAYSLAILALALIDTSELGRVAPSIGWASLNALLSAILALGFLPVFEWFTGITTDQTLLEWADPNRELLRKLSMEAPGTYAHTINVANLAESAAGAIGANGLLCRVGLYYHDIGKMLKPHYFVENQPDSRNPHDRLKPDTSATIVREHVTEGYRLAQEAKVPELVASFIPEHHGTQRIGFFWERAKEEFGEENLDEAAFRYPGPKPQSRETAIAMLADSVESATRALQDPTPQRVRDLIHTIVFSKISDGQLDEAPLTMGEIATIEENFIKVLSGIYHHRIDYPTTRHLTNAPEGSDQKVDEDSDQELDQDADGDEASEVTLPGDVRAVSPRLEEPPTAAIEAPGGPPQLELGEAPPESATRDSPKDDRESE